MFEILSTYILSLFPEGFDPMGMFQVLMYIIAVVFIVAMLIRLVHEKASQYNHALSSAMALMFMYLLLFQVRNLLPETIDPVLSKLPLIDVNLNSGSISLYRFSVGDFSHSCREFLYLFILSFCLIGLDDIIPDAKNTTSWMILQFIIACVAVAVYSFVLKLVDHFAPGILDSFAPMLLVCILLFMVLLGLLKVILTLMLTVVNPLLGAVSAFFSSNKLGMALGKSVMCSFILAAMCIFMNWMGFSHFQMADLTLLACSLPMIVLAILWVVLGFVL